jgi:hypothetical protein
MDFRQKVSWTSVALAVVLVIGGPSMAGAQGGRVPEPYTPAKDAKDLRAVLFNWERNMGMLKGHDERDMVAMLEHHGNGTIQVDSRARSRSIAPAPTTRRSPECLMRSWNSLRTNPIRDCRRRHRTSPQPRRRCSQRFRNSSDSSSRRPEAPANRSRSTP